MTNYVLEARGLSRRFGRQWAVQDLTMKVPRGSVYGFLGLNGAGKSTTIRMAMGLLPPDAGDLRTLGIDPLDHAVAVRRRVGYVPDVPLFYEWMSVEEIVAFVARYRQPEWKPQRATELMKRFELNPAAKLAGLSKGQRTRVSLLLALAYDPEFLILDEPTGGLDPVMRRQVLENVLSEYMSEERTILISSHLINEIAGLVDQVGILKDGKLAREQSTESLLDSMRRVRLVFEGEAPKVTLPGVLSQRRSGREVELVIECRDEAEVMRAVDGLNPTGRTMERVTLEESFVAVVAGGGG